MRKFIATILAVLYLAASSGAVIEMHFCMGKFISASLLSEKGEKKSCSACGMHKKKHCCENKHQVIKTDKQYNVNISTVFITAPTFGLPSYSYSHFNSNISEAVFFAFPLANSPPGARSMPAYIINCAYLI